MKSRVFEQQHSLLRTSQLLLKGSGNQSSCQIISVFQIDESFTKLFFDFVDDISQLIARAFYGMKTVSLR